MITVTLYYLPGSEACERVRGHLESIQGEQPHDLVSINVALDTSLKTLYGTRAPVVQVGPYTLEGEISRERLLVAIGAARDGAAQKELYDPQGYRDRLKRGHSYTSSDRLSVWITHNYIHVFNLVIFLYFGLSLLAPLLMKIGAETPAKILYKVYSPLCHQLAYRSWFFFGEQAYYPRQLADISGILTYEQVTGEDSKDVAAGRNILGNEVMGFKTALCQRDIAMYVSMWLFGVVFWLSKRKIRPLPWYLWVAFGVLPIAIDGFSQLPGVLAGMPAWLPIRESNPLLRSLTGCLFGVMTTWYLYPLIEDSMQETYRMMMRKQAIATHSPAKLG